MRRIEYLIRRQDGATHRFEVALDASTALRQPHPGPTPAWTALGFHQCDHCPLQATRSPSCPLAVALVDVVEVCRDLPSYEVVTVTVAEPERVVTAQTTAQRGLASLMGLVMATSGCPHTDFLRPMARLHLPFASEPETVLRATSLYLLGQYFIRCEGGVPDLEFSGLADRYRALETVNRAVVRRIWSAVELDASVNAVVLLDLLTKALPDSIAHDLHALRPLFVGEAGLSPGGDPVQSGET